MKFLYSLIYIAALGAASHFIGQLLPRQWFSPDKFPYREWKWEKGGRVYEKLGVKSWKDIVPDMSRIMPDMVKKKMSSAKDAEGLKTLIIETCVAEAVHMGLIIASLFMVLWWQSIWTAVFLIVYNVLGNLPFIIIQRYNRPRLNALYKRKLHKRA